MRFLAAASDAGSAVEAEPPAVELHELGEDGVELGRGDVRHGAAVIGAGDRGDHGPFGIIFQVFDRDEPRVQAVLQIVDGVGHVVGPVHHLSLQAAAAAGGGGANPVEHGQVGLVGAVLGRQVQGDVVGGGGGSGGGGRGRGRPRVLEGGVEGGAGEVQAGPGNLRLEPGQQAQGLGVALEAAAGQRAARVGQGGEGGLAVVAERRVAEIVRRGRPRRPGRGRSRGRRRGRGRSAPPQASG